MLKSLLASIAVAAATTTASAQNFEMFAPEDHPFVERYRAAPAVRAGDFIYISGVVGMIPPGTEHTPEAYEAAIRHAFDRVGETLAPAGAGWDDVIEMTTFHVDMRAHQEIFKTVREEFIVDKPYPAWTAIGVEKLWVDPLFVEIRVVAYVGE